MAAQVRTEVIYQSGIEYGQSTAATALVVHRTSGERLRLAFQDSKGVSRGSITMPDSSAVLLAKTLLVVAEGHAPSVTAQLS